MVFQSRDLLNRDKTSEGKELSSEASAQVEVLQLARYEELSAYSPTSQALASIQRKAAVFSKTNLLFQLQEKAVTKGIYGNHSKGIIQAKGLPENLQKGVEHLSGQSMQDVNVHYNSDQPEKLGAHAYAQGTDIHIAKGQEKHLAHEAWHVVQQKEGRVKPTVQKKDKIPINDDAALEKEADIMGAKAITLGKQNSDTPLPSQPLFANPAIQKVEDEKTEQEEQGLEIETKESDLKNDEAKEENGLGGADDNNEKSGAEIEIKPETLVLSGTKGLYAKISSVFGKETSFGKLLNLVKAYESKTEEEEKELLKPQIVKACEEWLGKHPKSKKSGGLFGKLKSGFNRLRGKTKNDDKKRTSVELIKKRFSENGKSANIKLTTLADKQSLASKIKGVFGIKTTFKQIEEKYHEYQSDASKDQNSLQAIVDLLFKAKEIVGLIIQWEDSHKHGDSTMEGDASFKGNDQARKNSLEAIKSGIASLFIKANYKNVIKLNITGVKLDSLNKGVIEAKTLDLEVNLNGKTIKGNGSDVSIGAGGIDFKKVTLDYTEAIKIADGFEVSEPQLSISHKGDNYVISASGNIALDFNSPDLELNTKGNVQVNYDTSTSSFNNLALNGVSVTAFLLNKNLKLSAENINYASGIFSASIGTVFLKPFDLESKINDLSFSKEKGVDWAAIKIKIENEFNLGGLVSLKNPQVEIKGKSQNYAYHLEGDLGLKTPSMGGIDISSSGHVAIDGLPNVNNYNVSINNGAATLKYGEVFSGAAQGLELNAEKNELFSSSLELNLNLAGNTLNTNVQNFSIAEDGIDWKLASFDSENELQVGSFLKIKNVHASIAGKSQNYTKTAKGEISSENMFSNNLANINLENIKVGMLVNDGKWDFKIEGEHVHIDMFNQRLQIDSSSVNYENDTFKLGGLQIKMRVPQAGDLSASAKDITLQKNKVDWDEIKLNSEKEFTVGNGGENGFSIKAGQGSMKGKGENYKLGLNVGATFNPSQYIKGEGNVYLLWDHQNSKGLEISDYDLNLKATSPEIPDAMLPGLWPIRFRVVLPFAAGVVPMEADFGFAASAGVGFAIEGSMKKVSDGAEIKAEGTSNPKLSVTVDGSLGVGSSLAVKLAGFIEGTARAVSGVKLELNGKVDQQYNLISLVGNYTIDSNFIASLSAGVKAQALVIFEKKLYEVTLKKWELGSSKLEGQYDFKKGKDPNPKVKKTGLFKTKEISKSDILNPPSAESNTKEYLEAMLKFNQVLKEENAQEQIESIDVEADGITNYPALKSKKEKLVAILSGTIKATEEDEDYINYKNKLATDEKGLNKIVADYENYIKRQEVKRQQVVDGKQRRLFFKRTEEYYTNKIETKRIEFREKVQTNLDQLNEYLSKVSLFQNQINASKEYLNNIDSILEDPETNLSLIDAKIADYKALKANEQHQKYEIENFLSQTSLAQPNIDLKDDNIV